MEWEPKARKCKFVHRIAHTRLIYQQKQKQKPEKKPWTMHTHTWWLKHKRISSVEPSSIWHISMGKKTESELASERANEQTKENRTEERRIGREKTHSRIYVETYYITHKCCSLMAFAYTFTHTHTACRTNTNERHTHTHTHAHIYVHMLTRSLRHSHSTY